MTSLLALFANFIVIATKVGDYSRGTSSSDAVKAVNDLNTILENLGLGIGAVLIAIAIVKIVISLADENAKAKLDAGMMFGAGILFISISGVLRVINITGASVMKDPGAYIAANVITVIGTALSYAGAIVFAIAVIMLVIAIAQENSDTYVNASKMIMAGVGMLFGKSLLSGIVKLLQTSNKEANDWVATILNLIANLATWGALGLICCGVFKLVMGIRSEDDRDRNTGIRFLMAGIALLSMRAIYEMFGFGLTTSSTN